MEPADAPQPAYDPAVVAFYRQLLQVTPRVPVSKLIVFANCIVFLLMAVSARTIWSFPEDLLIQWGANYGPRTLEGHWWRLASCTFLHANLIHIALNMWVFWNLGPLVERLVGNVGFLLLYLVAGVCGSLASVYWRPEVLSVGASGAVFGVFGALMGFVLWRSDSVPGRVLAELRNSGLTFLGYNLVFGFAVQGIDMAAHLGGLASGFLCGLLMSQPLAGATPASRTWRNLWTAGVAGVAILAAVAWAPSAPADLERFGEVEDDAVQTYNELVKQYSADTLSKEEFATAIEQQILPPWDALRQHFEQLRNIRQRDQQRISLMTRYLRTRQETWEWQVKALRSNDEASRRQWEAKNTESQTLIRELNSLTK